MTKLEPALSSAKWTIASQVAAAVCLIIVAVISLCWDFQSSAAEATDWAEVPRHHSDAKVLERGISYRGTCNAFKRANPFPPDPFAYSTCEISGAACVEDKSTEGSSGSRRLIGRYGASCSDSYLVWFKLEISGVGERCAYRFGNVDRSWSHGGYNAPFAAAQFDAHIPGSVVSAWSADADKNTCVVGYGDLKVYIDLMSYADSSKERAKVVIAVIAAIASIVFCACAAWEFKKSDIHMFGGRGSDRGGSSSSDLE